MLKSTRSDAIPVSAVKAPKDRSLEKVRTDRKSTAVVEPNLENIPTRSIPLTKPKKRKPKPIKRNTANLCIKGQNCGVTCISRTKTCRTTLKDMSASGRVASDRISAYFKELGRKSQLKPTPKPRSKPRTKDLDISNLFGDISQLPKRGVTRFTTERDIFDLAPLVKQRFDNILNRGRGVSKSLGASEVDMSDANADFNKAIETDGKVVILGKLKRRERAREKVFADYKGEDNPWGNIKDIVRSTVAVTKIDEIPLAITAIEQEMASKGFKLLQQPKNHFANPLETGYRDINLVYVSPSGFATEVQVNTKEMLKAKEVAHTQYEELRTIDKKAKQKPLTPQEVERRKELIKQSRAIYDPAYLRSF